jgi:uncharacterized protein (DUF305 family)
MVIRQPHRVVVLAVAVGVTTAGCGDGEKPSIDVPAVAGAGTSADQSGVTSTTAAEATAAPDPAQAFSADDIEFLVAMIPHHTQAQVMVELAEQRAAAPGVRVFASSVRAAQQPELEQMTGWLASLGVDPSTAGGHDHGGGATEQDVQGLASLRGPEFDRRFLDLLTDHGLGATELAHAETTRGLNAGVRQLAAAIAQREWADLETMRGLR